jgi:hypothetical protein
MRRMSVTIALLTALALVATLVLGKPAMAGGVLIGVALSIFNLRLLDRQVARVHLPADADKAGKKRARNAIARAAGVRLGLVTALVVFSFIIGVDFSLGIVTGLAYCQLVFIVNTFRVVTSANTEER